MQSFITWKRVTAVQLQLKAKQGSIEQQLLRDLLKYTVQAWSEYTSATIENRTNSTWTLLSLRRTNLLRQMYRHWKEIFIVSRRQNLLLSRCLSSFQNRFTTAHQNALRSFFMTWIKHSYQYLRSQNERLIHQHEEIVEQTNHVHVSTQLELQQHARTTELREMQWKNTLQKHQQNQQNESIKSSSRILNQLLQHQNNQRMIRRLRTWCAFVNDMNKDDQQKKDNIHRMMTTMMTTMISIVKRKSVQRVSQLFHKWKEITNKTIMKEYKKKVGILKLMKVATTCFTRRSIFLLRQSFTRLTRNVILEYRRVRNEHVKLTSKLPAMLQQSQQLGETIGETRGMVQRNAEQKIHQEMTLKKKILQRIVQAMLSPLIQAMKQWKHVAMWSSLHYTTTSSYGTTMNPNVVAASHYKVMLISHVFIAWHHVASVALHERSTITTDVEGEKEEEEVKYRAVEKDQDTKSRPRTRSPVSAPASAFLRRASYSTSPLLSRTASVRDKVISRIQSKASFGVNSSLLIEESSSSDDELFASSSSPSSDSASSVDMSETF
jgi:hypothetical protein